MGNISYAKLKFSRICMHTYVLYIYLVCSLYVEIVQKKT